MKKVTVHMGHDVPEGATHYSEESKAQREGFYKKDGLRPLFFSINLNSSP